MVNTIDGFQHTVANIRDHTCCPLGVNNICSSDVACSYINLLPSGPLWDRGKIEAKEYIVQAATGGSATPQINTPHVAYYAAYAGERMEYLVRTVLWPTLRETNPETAITTLDDWLERLGWRECFNACGERVGGCNPYVFDGLCGKEVADCAPAEPLNSAIKRAIAISLYRLQRGIHRTLPAINFIIEPLDAVLSYDTTPECLDCATGVVDPLPPISGDCCEPTLFLDRIDDTITQVPPEDCTVAPLVDINSFYTCVIDGNNTTIRPGLLAAECIVRSLFTPGSICKLNIRRNN